MSLAKDERAALADEFARSGPDRPTLCAGWNTRRLLAHLLLRERQPWAASGAIVPALAPLTERVMAGYADTPWDSMVTEFRDGPPLWSPFRADRVDEMANGAEFFVHHEDVRRGEPGWMPRMPDAQRDAQLWQLITRMGRVLLRRSKVGVVLRRTDGGLHVVKTGPGMVVLAGDPGELVLHAFGREAANVEIEGLPGDVEAYRSASRAV